MDGNSVDSNLASTRFLERKRKDFSILAPWHPSNCIERVLFLRLQNIIVPKYISEKYFSLLFVKKHGQENIAFLIYIFQTRDFHFLLQASFTDANTNVLYD